MKLTFLNHASYFVETNDFLFIVDPWLEGEAFNNGWSLLDSSTSNSIIIQYLKNTKKNIYIWYSHEHSDHFAIPFLKLAKVENIDIHVLFQNSFDQRVLNFVNGIGFRVTLLNNGVGFKLSENSEIKVWSWKSGDSFSLLNLNGFVILNLNDCIVKDDVDSLKLKKLIDSKVDILFTQFGYASWCGNEDDYDLRRVQAEEKCLRISSQINTLKPNAAILFASFVYFSHADNFYLNDQQNSPKKIRANSSLSKFKNNIFFMKPYDEININRQFVSVLANQTDQAEEHWQNLFDNIKPRISASQVVDYKIIELAFNKYKSRVSKAFLYLFSVAELLKFIKPIRIKVDDIYLVVELSYVRGIKLDMKLSDFDLAMKGEVLLYAIERDYGFDSTHVNGRFKSGNSAGEIKSLYFFGPQNLIKNGFGIGAPIATLKELYRLMKR